MNSALVSATLGMPLRTFIFAMTDPPRPVEDSALFLSSTAGNRLQRLEVGGGGRQGLAFDGAVVADQLDTARRQHRAAAGLAAGLRRDQRLDEALVDLGHQLPGALVGHVHRAAGGRDRTFAGDALEQRHLAGAQPALLVEIDADAKTRHRPSPDTSHEPPPSYGGGALEGGGGGRPHRRSPIISDLKFAGTSTGAFPLRPCGPPPP